MTTFDKEGLLRRIEEAGDQADSWTLPTFSTSPDEISAFALKYGVHPSFLLLLISIGGNDLPFWRQVVESAPAGADTRLLVARWIDWLWTDPAAGFGARISNAQLKACGDAVCDLQSRAAAGEDISRIQWREARFALLKAAESVDDVQASAAGGAAAAAWDLDSVPGAAADMIYALKTTLFAEIDRDLGWNEEKETAATERHEKMHAAGLACAEGATAQSGASANDQTPDEATQTRMRELYQKGAQDYLAANPSELDRRGEMRNSAYAEMYRLAREGLVSETAKLEAERSPAPVA